MRLGVNIDHVATLRQARRGRWPDPVEAARLCERAGASSIVCHLREDRRHIQDEDVRRLKRVATRLNLEMSIARSVVQVALAVKPAQVTLVPERRQELTTEGGLDVVKFAGTLRPLVRSFRQRRIEVSVFIDPVLSQVRAAHRIGADQIELHTGRYAHARTARAKTRELHALQRAAGQGHALGLAIAAGHGLEYDNVRDIVRLQGIEELNIGFSIVTRALWVGLEHAVKEMVTLLEHQPTHAIQAA